MNPTKRLKDTKLQQTQDHVKDISSIWNSLGRLSTGKAEGAERQSSLTGQVGTRRKFNRLAAPITKAENVSTKQRSRRTESSGDITSRALVRSKETQHGQYYPNGLNEESPKRVDFSRTHQLREVNWDGTYQDRLTFPTNSEGSGSNSSISSVIQTGLDLDTSYIRHNYITASAASSLTAPPLSSISHGFTSPPFTPPPSVSNSTTDFHLISPPSSLSSSLTTSPSTSPTTTTEQSPDVRWIGYRNKTVKPLPSASRTTAAVPATSAAKAGRRKGNRLKLTGVDQQLVSTKTEHKGVVMGEPSLPHQKHPGLSAVRKQVEDKWTPVNRTMDRATSELGRNHPQTSQLKGVAKEVDADGGEDVHNTAAINLNSPRLRAPFKLPITADLKDSKIILKLREKLKHQRALASSSGSTSQDTSLTSETSSMGAPPRHPEQPTSLPATEAAPRLDKPRKIAASHSSPTYKGFSEVTSDLSSPWRLNTKLKKNDKILKQPPLQPKKHDLESIKLTPQTPSPDLSKKMTRVTANRKSAKPGVSNIITTSSWRAGQDLIMKELGLVPKVRRSPAQDQATPETRKVGTSTTPMVRTNLLPIGSEGRQHRRQPGDREARAAREEIAAPSGSCDEHDDAHLLDEAIANTRVLSNDARSVLNEVQQGNSEDMKQRSPQRPALKRKAPKTPDPEKLQQPSEKTRHYDQESVRKFMAKQKAERLKRQHEEKIAHQKASERKQQILQELAEKQKQAAKRATPGRGGEGDRKRKNSDGRNKENMECSQQDLDDNSTLTEDTEESTPRATPGGTEEDRSRQRKRSKDNEVGVNTNQHAHNVQTVSATPATSAAAAAAAGSGESAGDRIFQVHGQNLNVDMGSMLNHFTQVVIRRQSQEPSAANSATSNERSVSTGLPEFQLQVNNVFTPTRNPDDSDIAFSLGTSNSMAKTIEERRQAIKATAMTLQNRLVEEKMKMAVLNRKNQTPHGTDTDFLSRYDRIAGKGNDFAVFTSDLPGSHAVVGETSNFDEDKEAATRIQAAYRGHSVRRMLDWELPSGQTFRQSLRHSQQNKPKSQAVDNDDDDVSGLTETSTFSEITSAEGSDVPGLVNVSGNKRLHSNRHHREAETVAKTSAVTYKPTSVYAWADTEPDPYSVMSVFSRQSRYLAAGSRLTDMHTAATTCTMTTTSTSTTTSGFVANLDLTSVKQPLITSTEQIMHQHTAGGQSVFARTRYTRVEAVVSEKMDGDQWSHGIRSDSELSAAESSPLPHSKHVNHAAMLSRSGDSSRLDKLGERASEKSKASAKTYSNSFESSSEEDETANFKRNSHEQRPHQHYTESGVSHLNDHAYVYVKSKLEPTTAYASGAHGAVQDTPTTSYAGDTRAWREPSGRLSPRSLGNKFSASLNFLESMEESLRHVVGMERARGVAIAQQETVSVAQILKARQLEHNKDLQNLRGKAHREAKGATQDIDTLRANLEGRPRSAASLLLENQDNLRPESRVYSLSASSRSSGETSEEKEALTRPSLRQHNKRSSTTTGSASEVKEASLLRTAREDSYTSVKTEENIRTDLSSSSRTPSELDGRDSQASSIPEEVPEADDSYSLSFDESFTEVLPSESHRKEVRRWSGDSHPISARHEPASLETAHPDLSSLFAGEDSFNRFTVDMVQQIMREEECRAQHQTAVLNLREAALKEKAKAELAWLQQLKRKPRNRAADDVFPNLDKKERKIKKNLLAQQNEIRRLKEANKIASMERRLLLQQHEEIARLKQTTLKTLQKLNGPVAKEEAFVRVPDVHTEDEIGETSDVSDEIKDSKSDSEVNRKTSPTRQSKRPKTGIEKQQKLRLDEKFMTTREQKLHERQKQAKELVEWKKKLDAEEEVFRLEKKAIEELEGKGKQKKKEEVITKKASKQVSASKRDDSYVVSDHVLSSMHEELDQPGARVRSHVVMSSVSEAVPTEISVSKTDTGSVSRSASEVRDKERPKVEVREKQVSVEGKKSSRSLATGGSVGSIPEEIPTVVTGDKQVVDSSDDTLVNSSANDDYVDTFEQDGLSTTTSQKKSSVSKRILRGSSPLPSPWSRRTGSESESEDSISHTETVSDVSDYEARIRQLSDELKRRRKEIEILRKERSRREKEKLKAREEAMQKQLDMYNRCIQQLKLEKDDLERESPLRVTVKPQIKQPKIGSHVKSKQARRGEAVSASFDELPDSTDSNQTSPSVDGTDANVSPADEKGKRMLSEKLINRLSEVSEPHSDKSMVKVTSPTVRATEKTKSSSVSENIEELSHLDTDKSLTTPSSVLKIPDSVPALEDTFVNKISDLTKDNEKSHSIAQPVLSNNKIPSTGNNGPALGKQLISNEEISEYIEEQYSIESKSVSSPRNGKADEKVSASQTATTGIQESDSENESRVNSYYTSVKSEGSSRPSSERSLASISYSPEDEEEEDVISYGSDKVPSRPQSGLHDAVTAATEDNISEHISASLPSISEKRISHSGLLYQDMIDSLVDYKEDDQGEDADKTPIPTPREMASTPVPGNEEENNSLLATDPLADFALGDRVLVGGRKPGVLLFKGRVDFSPGIWAGVELDAEDGDSDGHHEGKQYFTCPPRRGVIVHGSDIVAASSQPKVDISEISEEISTEESFSMDRDDSHIENKLALAKPVPVAADADLLHSAAVISPVAGEPTGAYLPAAVPTKKDMTLIANAITDYLAASLVEDSVKVIEHIAAKKSHSLVLSKLGVKAAHTVHDSVKSSHLSPEPLSEEYAARGLTSQEAVVVTATSPEHAAVIGVVASEHAAVSKAATSEHTVAARVVTSEHIAVTKPATSEEHTAATNAVTSEEHATIAKAVTSEEHTIAKAVTSEEHTIAKAVTSEEHTIAKAVTSEEHTIAKAVTSEEHTIAKAVTSEEHTIAKAVTSEEHTIAKAVTSEEHTIVKAVTSEEHTIAKAVTSEEHTIAKAVTSEEHATIAKAVASEEHATITNDVTSEEHATIAKAVTSEEHTIAKAVTSEEHATITNDVTSEEHATTAKAVTSEEQITPPKVPLGEPPHVHKTTFKSTESVIKTLLDDAIAHMLDVKKKKVVTGSKISTSITELLANNNNILHGEFADQSFKSYLDDSADEDKIQDDSGLSLDPVQRPGSPVPSDTPSLKDRNKLNDEVEWMFGDYLDDDLDFEQSTARPPPPYPLERSVPLPEDISPVVPHTREEIAPIVSRAVEVYWEKRRYGESLEGVEAPPDFLLGEENEVNSNRLTVQSRRSWRMMLFDLTGEIIRDIYSSDDQPDVQVWQKSKHKSQKYFHKTQPPTTIQGLQPVVQGVVFQLLGLNGTRRYNTVNKWNIRKKKDLVDAILTQELGEEELGWVDYDDDELKLKVSLAESIFDSLVLDTVHTLNGIYQKKQFAG